VRKITKNGNSLTIVIPTEFLHALNLLPGDDVVEIYDPAWEGFVVRAARPRPLQAMPAAPSAPAHV
jgi:antitoxin component of MazEF toxin-antitoxin module